MQPLALFDLDGTLVDHRGAFCAWAEEFAIAHRLDEATLTFLVFAGTHHIGPKDTFFRTVCETFELSEPPEQLWQQYRRRMPQLATCLPEDLDALRRLRAAGWRIAIVTNGKTDNQLGKILNTGLSELVDGWVISDDVGIRKPDPVIFRFSPAAVTCAQTSSSRVSHSAGNSCQVVLAGTTAVGRAGTVANVTS